MINQYSKNGESVVIELTSNELLFVDPLYLQDIKTYVIDQKTDVNEIIDYKNFVISLEEKVFPYGGGVLLGYHQQNSDNKEFVFDPKMIERQYAEELKNTGAASKQKNLCAFGVDSASILIIDFGILGDFIKHFTYVELVDAVVDEKMPEYVSHINEKVKSKAWAYISSPGINSGYAFEGDGSYCVNF